MKRTVLIASLLAIVFAQTAQAELKVGDKAPKLSIAKWIKGDSVDLSKAKPDDVYVIEFWATWCGPCLAGIPHLSELQDHFKDKHLTIIAVTDEKKSIVKKFLKDGWDAKMRFTIAIDDEEKSWKDWMKAAGQEGIPTAFAVKDGKILWIGHSAEPKLELIIAEACGDDAYAAKMKKLVETSQKLGKAIEGEQWPEAVKLIDVLSALKPGQTRLAIIKYQILLSQIKNVKQAAACGQKLVEECDSANDLNELAWGILTDEELEGVRDIKLAIAAAEKAMELSKKQDPAIIDTYARALMMSGDLKGAIEWQKKAIKACENDRLAGELKKALEEYQEMTEKQAKEQK